MLCPWITWSSVFSKFHCKLMLYEIIENDSNLQMYKQLFYLIWILKWNYCIQRWNMFYEE